MCSYQKIRNKVLNNYFILNKNKIFFLPKNFISSQHLYQHFLHNKELDYCSEIKNDTSRLEYLNSRLLFRILAPNSPPMIRTPINHKIHNSSIHSNGSLSHKNGHVIGALTDKTHSIGIDLEIIKKKNLKTLRKKICSEKESDVLTSINTKKIGLSDDDITLLVFSFKESVYKCYQPLEKKHLDFHDCEINNICFDKKEISARLANSENYKKNILGHFYFLTLEKSNYLITQVCQNR